MSFKHKHHSSQLTWMQARGSFVQMEYPPTT